MSVLVETKLPPHRMHLGTLAPHDFELARLLGFRV